MECAITCSEVVKHFGRTEALKGVTLTVPKGSVFGFLGPNGAGKSTLLKIMVGLVRPNAGRVSVMGGKPGSPAVQAAVGYLAEQFRFPAWMTGDELLSFHLRLAGLRPSAAERSRLLRLVGLDGAGGRRIGGYSKGMQQRLGIAQSLVGRPRIVFLDEPTSALDPLGRLDVRDLLLQLRTQGVTVFLNSHLLTEVERVCDSAAVVNRGVVVAQGALETLLQRPSAQLRVGWLTEDRLAALLKRVEDIAGNAPTHADGLITVATSQPGQIPALVQVAVELGVPVYEAGPVRQTLEEAFVKLIRERSP
ncbi:MAG: ABC transporter ATP-binding protein [Actinobacteria bacterium]|nr:ABC transporter ATP-binding protein [Actinomycetota bacterium]